MMATFPRRISSWHHALRQQAVLKGPWGPLALFLATFSGAGLAVWGDWWLAGRAVAAPTGAVGHLDGLLSASYLSGLMLGLLGLAADGVAARLFRFWSRLPAGPRRALPFGLAMSGIAALYLVFGRSGPGVIASPLLAVLGLLPAIVLGSLWGAYETAPRR